jgi:hypothetical protein
MAYILSTQRDSDEPKASMLWHEYHRYIRSNKSIFPPGAYALATSDWYYDFSDHRAPHDAWLEWAKFEEPATGERNEIRHLSLRVRLLGAYHDMYLEFFYPKVFAYSLNNRTSANGNSDWRYDEFRLSPNGHLLHEIEWAGGPGIEANWLIEASDVELSFLPRDSF